MFSGEGEREISTRFVFGTGSGEECNMPSGGEYCGDGDSRERRGGSGRNGNFVFFFFLRPCPNACARNRPQHVALHAKSCQWL